jgi:Cu(I)/Ag(I) efflux system membrane protein CusA/SilA
MKTSIRGPIRPCLYRAKEKQQASIATERFGVAITLVPILMVIFIRGKLRPESENPISRVTQALYLPVLRLCLKYRKTTLLLNLAFLVVTFPLMFKMGSQFMPPLFEGLSLYMPTALPGISITQASQLLQEQDRILRSFPEVETVFGVVGRSDRGHSRNVPYANRS